MKFEKIWSNEQMDDILTAPNYMIPIYDDIHTRNHFAKVLDLGCGNGYFTSYLKKYNPIIHGVDGSQYGVNESQKNGFNECFLIGNFDYDQLPVATKYDFIICKDVLEHVLFPAELLIKAREVLEDKGTFFVLVPNHFSLYYRIKFLFTGDVDVPKYFPNEPKWSYPHIRFMRHQDMLALFTATGFVVEKDYTSHFEFFVPRGNGIFKKLGILSFLSRSFPNLFSTAFAFNIKKKH